MQRPLLNWSCLLERHHYGIWRPATLGWSDDAEPWFSVRYCKRCGRIDIGPLTLTDADADRCAAPTLPAQHRSN